MLSNRTTGRPAANSSQSPTPAARSPKGRHRQGRTRTPNTTSTASPGTSTSNTVTEAIAGVTLTLAGAHHRRSRDDRRAAARAERRARSKRSSQVVRDALQLDGRSDPEAAHDEAAREPPERRPNSATGIAVRRPANSGELLTSMRQAMYEPIEGLPDGNVEPARHRRQHRGATAGGKSSQAALSGHAEARPRRKLAEARRRRTRTASQMMLAAVVEEPRSG